MNLRKTVLEMCVKAGTGHVTSCFSCVEILEQLFYKIMRPEDVFILSKGQASPLLYAILADKGLIDEAELWKFAQKDGKLGVHLDHHIPGAVVTAGSLGHGLGIACGMAYADRKRRVFCLLGDGECYEGSVWEAAMFAGQHKLSNLIAIIDYNRLMVHGKTNLSPQFSKWFSFNWDVVTIDGHYSQLEIKDCYAPKVIIAYTVKGKGIDFMENKWEWHGVAPKGEDIERARRCLQEIYFSKSS